MEPSYMGISQVRVIHLNPVKVFRSYYGFFGGEELRAEKGSGLGSRIQRRGPKKSVITLG